MNYDAGYYDIEFVVGDNPGSSYSTVSMYIGSTNDENGNKPIFFGDLSFYWILQRDKLAVKTLSEKFALQGAIGYVGTERLDGKLIRSEAVKTLKITA